MILSRSFLFISFTVVLIVIILANIELYYNESHCRYKTIIPKKLVIISSKELGITHPVYVYNKTKIKRTDITYQLGFDESKYVKKKIPEHVASKIFSPIRDIGVGIKTIPKTRMPINTLYSSLGKSDEVIGNVNPLTYVDTSDYRMLIHKNDEGIEAFFASDMLYFI